MWGITLWPLRPRLILAAPWGQNGPLELSKCEARATSPLEFTPSSISLALANGMGCTWGEAVSHGQGQFPVKGAAGR